MSEIELSLKAHGDGLWTNMESAEDMRQHSLVTPYLNATGAPMVEDANAGTTAKMPCIGITVAHMYPGQKGQILLYGWIRIPDRGWANQVPLYVDDEDGVITDSNPGAATSQEVATHFYDGWILFNPKVYTINI